MNAPLLSPPFGEESGGVGSLFLHFLKRVEDVFLRFPPLDFRGCRGVTAGIKPSGVGYPSSAHMLRRRSMKGIRSSEKPASETIVPYFMMSDMDTPPTLLYI